MLACGSVRFQMPCPLRVISGHWIAIWECPLCPRKRTYSARTLMSAKCQKRTVRLVQRLCLLYAFGKSEPPKHRLESEPPVAASLHTIAHVRHRAPTLVVGHLFVCRPWIRQIALAVQRRIHSRIIAIDIVEGRERAVVVYAQRKIGDVDGDLLVECNVVIAPRIEGRFDPQNSNPCHAPG